MNHILKDLRIIEGSAFVAAPLAFAGRLPSDMVISASAQLPECV